MVALLGRRVFRILDTSGSYEDEVPELPNNASGCWLKLALTYWNTKHLRNCMFWVLAFMPLLYALQLPLADPWWLSVRLTAGVMLVLLGWGLILKLFRMRVLCAFVDAWR